MYELTVNLVHDNRIPLYEQIYRYIQADIRDGRIACHEKLPSTRALSKHLGVSRSTIELAYEQLLSEGYIESLPYKGYYVAKIDQMYHLSQDVDEKEIRSDMGIARSEENESHEYGFDFSLNGVDLDSFPYTTWKKLFKEVLSDDKEDVLLSGHAKGEKTFRQVICNYLYQARGVECKPSQVILGAGSDYLFMILRLILGDGQRFAFEDPTYKQAFRIMKSLDYETIPISMDKYGMRMDLLEESEANIAYVMPSHQFPTGIVMPLARRMELLKWAGQSENRFIIEDDYDSEFRYKGRPIPALQGFDAKGKVIYLGSFSKSIAPAIRLSYLVLPECLIERFEEKCGFISTTVPKDEQRVVERFIKGGHYERHLNKMRALYKSRHDILIEELKSMNHLFDISGEHAGVHLILKFKNGASEEELIQKAKTVGVRVYGLSEYLLRENYDYGKQNATILLGFANLKEEEIREAVERLRNCWQ